jgi:predicted Fe-Mo cluster-binding NifX family protein
MIIALCSTGEDLDSKVDERFGRATYFLIYNTENSEFTCIENSAKNAKGGAGALAVQQIVDHKAELVIAPEVGPQALDALKKFNIPAYKQGGVTTVQDAIAAWNNKELKIIEAPGNKGLHKA